MNTWTIILYEPYIYRKRWRHLHLCQSLDPGARFNSRIWHAHCYLKVGWWDIVTHVILMFIAPKDAGIWYWEYQPTRRGCCAWWLLISSPFAVYGTIDAISAHCCGWDPPNRLILGYSLPRCNGTFPDFPANHVFFSPAIAVSSSNARARARRRWSSEPPMKPEKPFRCSTGARANRRGRSKLGL